MKVIPINAIMTYRMCESRAPSFITSALAGSFTPRLFYPVGNSPIYSRNRNKLDPTGGVEVLKKRKYSSPADIRI
jgi:hypothetical protein